jgi:hypothetical protein
MTYRTTRTVVLKYDDAATYIRDCTAVRLHMKRVMDPPGEKALVGSSSIYADLDLESITLRRCLITESRATESDPMAEGFSGEISLNVVFPG